MHIQGQAFRVGLANKVSPSQPVSATRGGAEELVVLDAQVTLAV